MSDYLDVFIPAFTDYCRGFHTGQELLLISSAQLKEGDLCIAYRPDQGDDHNWLWGRWLDYLGESGLAVDDPQELWCEVFGLLRSLAGTQPSECFADLTNIDLMYAYLYYLAKSPIEPILEIQTGLDEPPSVGYILDGQVAMENCYCVEDGKLVPFLFGDANDDAPIAYAPARDHVIEL